MLQGAPSPHTNYYYLSKNYQQISNDFYHIFFFGCWYVTKQGAYSNSISMMTNIWIQVHLYLLPPIIEVENTDE